MSSADIAALLGVSRQGVDYIERAAVLRLRLFAEPANDNGAPPDEHRYFGDEELPDTPMLVAPFFERGGHA
jgi:hypothetical protein